MCKTKIKRHYQSSFSEELESFAAYVDTIPFVNTYNDTLHRWKQIQYSIIDDIFKYISRLSIKYKEIYNKTGPFSTIFDSFNKLSAELIAIIKNEKSYGAYVDSDNVASIRIFLNKISAFISNSLILINDSRDVGSGLPENPLNKEIFLVHGSDEKVILEIKKVFKNTNINLKILESTSQIGLQYIFDKFEENARVCSFAIVILNSLNDTEVNFRPNVLIELGYFLRHLGKKRIIIVTNCSEDKMPSDIRGVYVVKTTKKLWTSEIKKSLIKSGFEL